MVRAGPALDIEIFPKLDCPFRANNEQPSITPGRQAIGGEPIDPDIAGGLAGGQVNIAVILKAGRVGIGAVRGARRQNLRILGAGEKQELFALVRGDVDQHPAIVRPVEKPIGPVWLAQPMRTKAGRVDHLADHSGLDQIACLHCAGRLEMFRIEDGNDPLRFRLDLSHRFQLLKRRHARLVQHHILAMTHGGNSDLGAVGGNGRRQDQGNRWIFKDLSPVGNAARLWVACCKGLGQFIFFCKNVENSAPASSMKTIWPKI